MREFDFIKTAIGTKTTWTESLNESDWKSLYDFCARQTLIGIGFSALEKLHAQGYDCPRDLWVDWMSNEMAIRQENTMMNELCTAFTEEFSNDGFDTIILKGQSNLPNYPEHLRMLRQSGDIDIWVVPNDKCQLGIKNGKPDKIKSVTEYLVAHGVDIRRIRYNHLDLTVINNVVLEAHFRVGFFAPPYRNRRLQKWFSQQFQPGVKNRISMGFSTLTPSANLMHLLTHMFIHYIGGNGVGFRQLLDIYYAVIRQYDELQANSIDANKNGNLLTNKDFYETARYLGMGKFLCAVMWTLHEVFGLDEKYYICTPNEKEGQKLLNDILLSGNFGQYDTRGKRLKEIGVVGKYIWKLKRIFSFITNYPEDALWEPYFRIYHYLWRKKHSKL